MAQIIYSAQALADLDRLTDFLLQDVPAAALQTAELIIEAVDVLENHPLIGRDAEHELKELVISRGKSGYVALYSYESKQDNEAKRNCVRATERGKEAWSEAASRSIKIGYQSVVEQGEQAGLHIPPHRDHAFRLNVTACSGRT